MIKKEKSNFKVSDFNMKIFREDEVLDLRTISPNVVIEQLEANIQSRDMSIESRLKKKIDVLK